MTPPAHAKAREPADWLDKATSMGRVSRETAQRLQVIVQHLERWQPRINLVANSTMQHVWTRHVADSFQLAELAPVARTWVDLGSGGGFPGLVVAAVLMERQPDARVVLVESNGKKCAFLREVARAALLPVSVRNSRIEELVWDGDLPDVVSARALAPLPDLLGLSRNLLKSGAMALFPKGREWQTELTQSQENWTFDWSAVPSEVDAASRILVIRNVAPHP
jgi:16S rRNA (guanine527-N7)-methyltransferase